MDYEGFLKFVGAAVGFVASIYALRKAILGFTFFKRSGLRKDFKFTKSFLANLKSNHPYLVEKGFFAITGDASLSALEIICLLSLPSPTQALRYYSAAKKYLEIKAENSGHPKINFRKTYSEKKFWWMKGWYLALYVIFGFAATAPLYFAKEFSAFKLDLQTEIGLILAWILPMGYLSVAFLLESAKIMGAEKLLEMQSAHFGDAASFAAPPNQ